MITLVNPFTRRDNDTYLPQWEVCEHLGIASLMGALRKQGYACSVVNAYLREYTEEEAVEAALQTSPRLVGISILNENYAWSKAFARLLKRRSPGMPIVVGGYFPTIVGHRILADCSDVDFVIRGDGEWPLVALAKSVLEGTLPTTVPGLIYRVGSGYDFTPVGNMPALDTLPFPERDDAPLAIRILEAAGASPAMRLMTSRGCSYRCSFCNIVEYARQVDGGRRRVRAHSPGYVCDQIEALVDRFDVKSFVISDDVFLDRSGRSKSRVESFLDELDRRGMRIRFACQFRLDAFEERIFERMLRHGLVAVACGIESIEQDTIDFFQKDTTNQVQLDAVAALSRHADQVNVSLYMLVYHPLTTMEEVAANYEFLDSLGYFESSPDSSITRKMLATELQVFRGGRLEAQLADLGLLTADYDPSALDPAILPFRYLDPRVPEFRAAVYADQCQYPSAPTKAVFERHLDDFLRRPGPTRAELAGRWRAGRPPLVALRTAHHG